MATSCLLFHGDVLGAWSTREFLFDPFHDFRKHHQFWGMMLGSLFLCIKKTTLGRVCFFRSGFYDGMKSSPIQLTILGEYVLPYDTGAAKELEIVYFPTK